MDTTEAEKNLRECQRQLDADGVMVGVSRQALDEVLTELQRLRILLASAEDDLERVGQ